MTRHKSSPENFRRIAFPLTTSANRIHSGLCSTSRRRNVLSPSSLQADDAVHHQLTLPHDNPRAANCRIFIVIVPDVHVPLFRIVQVTCGGVAGVGEPLAAPSRLHHRAPRIVCLRAPADQDEAAEGGMLDGERVGRFDESPEGFEPLERHAVAGRSWDTARQASTSGGKRSWSAMSSSRRTVGDGLLWDTPRSLLQVLRRMTIERLTESRGACANCGTPLQGRYCHVCGQKTVSLDVSLRDLTHEALDELAHVDGKIVQTLKVLVTKPGFLTNEFLAGRRVRYVSPVAVLSDVQPNLFYRSQQSRRRTSVRSSQSRAVDQAVSHTTGRSATSCVKPPWRPIARSSTTCPA